FAEVHRAPRSKFGCTGAGPAGDVCATGADAGDSSMTAAHSERTIPRQPRVAKASMHKLLGKAEAGFYRYLRRSTPPVLRSSGVNRSPVFLNRARTLSRRKSSIRTPLSTSFQVMGVDTQARGCGRTEYTDASVRPHAFWL